eukprot:3448764-Rhodomonas_salina.4
MVASHFADEPSARVDLRLARAYVPICSSVFTLCLMLCFVGVWHRGVVHSWVVVGILLGLLRQFKQEVIFDSHSLLLWITGCSLLNEYRHTYVYTVPWQNVFPAFWGAHFLATNSLLSADAAGQHTEHALWVCHTLLLMGNLYTPLPNETWQDDIVRAVLFFTVSALWLYTAEAERLTYERAHDGLQLRLRFTALLFTPVGVSVCLHVLVLGYCVWSYALRSGNGIAWMSSRTEDGGGKGKKDDDLEQHVVDDTEIFRQALVGRSGAGDGAPG